METFKVQPTGRIRYPSRRRAGCRRPCQPLSESDSTFLAWMFSRNVTQQKGNAGILQRFYCSIRAMARRLRPWRVVRGVGNLTDLNDSFQGRSPGPFA